ncbi:hypothetical protein scyTo_0010547 [Scyliorhinus torazame]|uniref:Uncharacterized protein n=1 Tax=Scyliorhinus torazame TaxID=75743 RepID=A0A401P8B9_SCYTO|nr:hypothetical protein [Scyliorhinus torazame]
MEIRRGLFCFIARFDWHSRSPGSSESQEWRTFYCVRAEETTKVGYRLHTQCDHYCPTPFGTLINSRPTQNRSDH